ncbi:hypothetical protein N665_0546s0048 [Sinapis alba]|nr:hypothetical protein N665_0546s0048 [Sinapis alba]
MVNHKLIFQTFVDAVLKSMRLATKDDSFNWKSLGFVGAQKVANSLQTQVTGNEDNTQFSVSCKQFRHEFKVEDTTFHYTREDKSGKMKFQFKEFDELRAEFWKMKMEDEHFESMKEVLEERKEVKAMEEFKWRETLKLKDIRCVGDRGFRDRGYGDRGVGDRGKRLRQRSRRQRQRTQRRRRQKRLRQRSRRQRRRRQGSRRQRSQRHRRSQRHPSQTPSDLRSEK